MKLAAVDIGSNAIRLQVTKVYLYQGSVTFKKIEYLRFPLRLGKDVFLRGMISDGNRVKFIQLMNAFKLLIDLYEVDDYMVCATSALRESRNGKEIVNTIYRDIGLQIEIIDGDREAELINHAIQGYIDNKIYLHIDVGGGSTELSLYKNKSRVGSQSFNIGSVRLMEASDLPVDWSGMEKFIHKHLELNSAVTCIGTGGNINKILALSKPLKNNRFLELSKILEIQALLEAYSYEERIHILHLNEDRADVILPATSIYLAAMVAAKSKKMIVPDVGLKDGLINLLYERNAGRQSGK